MIKLMFKNMKKWDYISLVAITLFIVGQVWLDLKMPDYMNEITVMLTGKTATVRAVLTSGAYMLLCAVGSGLLSVMVGYLVARMSVGVAKRVRTKVFNKVNSFSMNEIGKFTTASLLTRSTNDISHVQRFVAMGLQALIKAPILAIWAIAKISSKNWQWTLTTGIAIAFILIVVTLVMSMTFPRYKTIQKLTDELNGVTREHLTGLRVVRAYNAEEYQAEKFEKVNTDITKTNVFIHSFMSLLSPAMNILMSGLSLAIYWIGAYLINNTSDFVAKQTLMGDMVVFSSYAIQVIMAFMLLVVIFIMLPRTSVASRRIMEVLKSESSIVSGNNTNIYDKKGEIEFKNVGFKYPDAEEYVLKDVSFKAKKGQTLAFIGSTGCGKSTLINLIPRFYDVTEGEILINGVNVKDYNLKDLHNKIGYVSQRAEMFSGTVESNITLGDYFEEPTKDDMLKAIDIAQAKDFVKSEDDLDKVIDQGGLNVSGGQKQRLSIARAVLRKPEICIFDDSFSALDYSTDKKLRDALKEELGETTCLIVAQRIGTIKNADKIIVLEDGVVVGDGTHDELLKTCEVYKEIALSQLSKEEL